MKSPFFSIVMPTYNRAAFIDKAIASVLAQTFKDFELIVVDDGSTDDTATEVAKWKDARVKFFFKQNEERSIARNFGLSKATGEYINFLDSDDYFYPHHLATMYSLLRKNNFPVIAHSGYEIRKSDGALTFVRNKLDTTTVRKKLIKENVLAGNSFIIHNSILANFQFLDSRDAVISEDWYLWLKLASRFPIIIDNTPTHVIVNHSARSLNNLNADKVEKSIRLIIDSLRIDREVMNFYRKDFAEFVARNYSFLALCFVSNRNADKTEHYLLKAKQEFFWIVFSRQYLAVVKNFFLLRLKKILRIY